MTLLHTALGITDFKSNPFLSNLVPAAAASYAVQAAFGVPSILRHTELLYDFSGGISFYCTLAASLVLPVLRARPASSNNDNAPSLSTGEWNWRQLVMTGATFLYAARLSTYLFIRVLKKGSDSRWDSTKQKPLRAAVLWLLQGLWVVLCCMPTIAVDSVPAAAFKALPGGGRTVSATDVLGLSLFVFGLAVEITADYQKSAWYDQKSLKLHDEQFITRGLWARSRYPNYFGDITLWTGMATTAAGLLVREPVQAALGWNGGVTGLAKAILLPALAPAFVSWALTRVSGVPLSEKKYDRLYRDNKEYQKWRNNTPLLVPKLF
ncbi:hypothetical protein B0H66DRAFT_562206 [Apodospora peruviana]|uniref:Steroid 5-alpha reductase C-terminal domain-containing protein n=1 Tax=Apodospora peruviana TaxID=516989 RepID=A0AAE0I1U8_9PEZI|nr:hypothetical protein B0H66DRAFT_562206 [Apodospora peruviana]